MGTPGRPTDPSLLSRDPAQVRRRLRRAKRYAEKTGNDARLKQDLAIYGEATKGWMKPVEEWDLEELAYGYPRHRDGKFRGRPPSWITGEVTREAKKRLHNEVFGQLGSQAHKALKVIEGLMMNDEVDHRGKPVVDPKTKLDAAKWIIEHILGKPEKVIHLDSTDSVRQAFAAAIVLDDGLPQGHLTVLEGEVVDDGEGVEVDAE